MISLRWYQSVICHVGRHYCAVRDSTHLTFRSTRIEKNVPNSWLCYKTFTLLQGNCYGNFVCLAPKSFDQKLTFISWLWHAKWKDSLKIGFWIFEKLRKHSCREYYIGNDQFAITLQLLSWLLNCLIAREIYLLKIRTSQPYLSSENRNFCFRPW